MTERSASGAPEVKPPSSRRRKLKSLAFSAALAFAVAGIGAQFVPMDGIGNNPPERFAVKAPPEVDAILRRSCYDCHTNETRWPWYARIAPASWLLIRDVKKGRSRMNMSEWSEDDKESMAIDMENSWDQIEGKHMPPWFYVFPMHLDASLSDKEKQLLKSWLLAHKTGDKAAAAR